MYQSLNSWARFLALGFILILTQGCRSGGANHSLKDSSLSMESKAALNQLTSQNPAAAAMLKEAKGVLVFPEIIKGGFIVGGAHGQGSMIQDGMVTGHYDTSAGSYGLQAGLQSFSYALFFMSEEDMAYLDSSSGWEIGVGPTVTIVDKGVASSVSTTTARSGVYCFFFDQKGLMAGLGLQGSKITRLDR